MEVAGDYIARHARYARRSSRACTRTSSLRIARVITVFRLPAHDRHARAASAAALARVLARAEAEAVGGGGWLLDQAAIFAAFKKAGAQVVLGPPKHRGWARYAHHRRADMRFVRPLDLPSQKAPGQGAGAERQRRGRPARTHDASGPRQRRAPRPGPFFGGSG